MHKSKNLIPLSECLELWAQKNSIEFPGKTKKRKSLKVGETSKGKLIGVDFKYLDDGTIEIYSARRLR